MRFYFFKGVKLKSRTIINVTGDSMVALVVGKSLGKLHTPHPKNVDDHYDKVKGLVS